MEKFMNYKDVRKILSEKFNWEDEDKAPLSMKYQPDREGVTISLIQSLLNIAKRRVIGNET